MIGNSDGRLIAFDAKIPLIRVGFPVYDRAGYHRRPIVGYNGGINLIDRITNTIMEKYYDTDPLEAPTVNRVLFRRIKNENNYRYNSITKVPYVY